MTRFNDCATYRAFPRAKTMQRLWTPALHQYATLPPHIRFSQDWSHTLHRKRAHPPLQHQANPRTTHQLIVNYQHDPILLLMYLNLQIHHQPIPGRQPPIMRPPTTPHQIMLADIGTTTPIGTAQRIPVEIVVHLIVKVTLEINIAKAKLDPALRHTITPDLAGKHFITEEYIAIWWLLPDRDPVLRPSTVVLWASFCVLTTPHVSCSKTLWFVSEEIHISDVGFACVNFQVLWPVLTRLCPLLHAPPEAYGEAWVWTKHIDCQSAVIHVSPQGMFRWPAKTAQVCHCGMSPAHQSTAKHRQLGLPKCSPSSVTLPGRPSVPLWDVPGASKHRKASPTRTAKVQSFKCHPIRAPKCATVGCARRRTQSTTRSIRRGMSYQDTLPKLAKSAALKFYPLRHGTKKKDKNGVSCLCRYV